MKKGWDRYATKKRYIQKGYLRKYRNGNPSWKTPETSCSNSVQQSRQSQKEEVVELSGISGQLEDPLMEYGRVVLLTEDVVYIGKENESHREENTPEAHQEGRQGIQESDQGRCEIEETNISKTKRKKMKKQVAKEKKHEAKETKAYEKKEDKREFKGKKK